MTTDLTDLFAADEPKPEKPKKKMGRPTREEALAKAMALEEPLPHYSVFRQPVGVTYLAKVVGKQPRVDGDDPARPGLFGELLERGRDDHATSPSVSSVKKQVRLPV